MAVLGLDPAAKLIGWARGNVGMRAPEFGVIVLPEPKKNYYLVMCKVREFLEKQFDEHGVDKVRFEAPYMGRNANTYMRQLIVCLTIEFVCGDRGVRNLQCSPGTWRSKTTGYTQAPKSVPRDKRQEWLKQCAVEYCHARSWPVTGHDEAEACCILAFQLGLEDDGQNFANLPLGAIQS